MMDVGEGEKGRKTEADVGGQCKCGLEGEGTVGGGDTKPGCVEATGQTHRPHVEVGKDGVEEEVVTELETRFQELFKTTIFNSMTVSCTWEGQCAETGRRRERYVEEHRPERTETLAMHFRWVHQAHRILGSLYEIVYNSSKLRDTAEDFKKQTHERCTYSTVHKLSPHKGEL